MVPHLAALLARFDGQAWKEVGERFEWKLRPGRNTPEIAGRNTAGVAGITSTLVLEYQPPR